MAGRAFYHGQPAGGSGAHFPRWRRAISGDLHRTGIRSPTVLLSRLLSIAPLLAGALVATTPRETLASEPLQPKTIEWKAHWKPFRTSEYVGTAALVAADVLIVLKVRDPDPRWDGALPFDGSASTLLRGGSGPTRELAQKVSDRMHEANFFFGLLEAPLSAGVGHGRWDVFWQTAWMNAEAYAVAGFVQLLSARLVGRVRPFRERCLAAGAAGEGEEFPCKEGGTTLSFISGHAMTSFVSAGLTCAHHSKMPLWGGGSNEVAACSLILLSATATGALRVVADKHYASDVIIGAVLGFGIGWGLPNLLHYGRDPSPKRDAAALRVLPPIPYATADRAGVAMIGLF